MRSDASSSSPSAVGVRKKDQSTPSVVAVFVFGLLVLIPVGLCVFFYYREVNYVEQGLRDRETIRVGLMAQVLRSDLLPVASVLRLLADGDGLRAYLDSNHPNDRDRIARRAAFVSRQRPEYDQIRYLNERGFEVVRSNRNGVLVPDDQLQDKSDRGYFRQALGIDAGKVFVSAFDLNVEKGKVEEPFRPTIRFATPVLDSSGNRRGVYVINFLGGELLQHLFEVAPVVEDRLRLLNPAGHWMRAETPDMEWGGSIPDRAHYSLAKTDPELWAKILAVPEGQARWHGGLFTWERVTAVEFAGGGSGVIAREPYWIMASAYSAADWNDALAGVRRLFSVAAVGLAALTGISLWFFRGRRRAISKLRHSEKDLAVTLDSIGDAVIATDRAGKITRMNGVAESLTGWPLPEALGRPIADVFRIINELTRAPAVIPVDDVLKSGEMHALANHTTLIARDGTERSIADSAAPIRDDEGVLGVVLVFRDVSAERQAVEAQALLAAIIGSSSDAIVGSSLDGKITSWNHAAEELFGYRHYEAIGQPARMLLPPGLDDEPDIDGDHESGSSHFECIRMHRDGKRLDVSIALSPIVNDVGQVIGRSQIIRDIRASKEAEALIFGLNSALRERAAQLESSNSELESFSYSVSHDLRAPLRHVQGFVDLLAKELKDPISEKAQRYLKVIGTAGKDMGELIDSLLSFSRMGRAELRESTIDLNAVILDCRRTLEVAVGERQIRWQIPTLPKVQGDSVMIRQVFINLLGNAVKYTRDRPVAEITVGCSGREEDRLIFFVRDNGAGFDMKYVEKLFGVFQRLHRADEFEGTGIGLANVRRIILRHGGRAWAEGKVHEGATFFFTLKPAVDG